MATSNKPPVQQRRSAMRTAISVPDPGAKDFAQDCSHQIRIVASADVDDRDLITFLDSAGADLIGEET